MPIFFEASIIRRIARVRQGETIKGTVTVVGGQQIILAASQLRVSAVIRNTLNFTSPAATDRIQYAYSEADLLAGNYFEIEPGASIAIEALSDVWAQVSGATDIPFEVDQGLE